MASNIPNITEFLADWSIERNDGKVLVDGEKFMGSNPYMMQVVQASGEETGEKVNNSQFIVSPYSQELKILTKNNEAIVAPVLQTYDTSFSVDPSTQQTFDDKSVKNICLVSKKEKQIGHEIDTYKIASSKVMVLGSAYFTKPELLLQSNLYNNSAVLLNAINKMTGKEIRDHLEMSYDLWANTMKSPDDHVLLLADMDSQDQQRYKFKNFAFNFDSAAGIDYIVDVTRPDGEKVTILQMSDGEPFDESRWYKVVMNSYRGNGGGELLTKGAGIPLEDIPSRIVYQSEKDLRFYLMQEIEKAGTLSPKAHNNWRFVPEEWTAPAIERDKALLFNK